MLFTFFVKYELKFFIYNFMDFSPYSPETRVRYRASQHGCFMGTVAKGYAFPQVLWFALCTVPLLV